MPDTPAWSVVVVNYNSGDLLARCVASVLADASTGTPPEVVVVDNASCDRSLQQLADDEGDVAVVRSPRNLGYAAAANLGIARTSAPVVAVLNPDTWLEPGTGAALLARLADQGIGAVGPRLINPDGSTYPSARSVPSVGVAVGHGLLHFVWEANPFTRRYRQLGVDPSTARDVDWVSGAAVWLRRDALEQVGGWDERYFMYVEDVDLCWRLRRAGWRVVYEPAGRVEHVQGTSTRTRPYRMLFEHHRSLWRFAVRRFTGPRRVLLAPAAVFLAARALLAMAHHALAARPGWRRPQAVA